MNQKRINRFWGKLAIYLLLILLSTVALGMIQQLLKIPYEWISLPQFAPLIAYLLLTIFYKELRTSFNVQLNRAIGLKLLLALFLPTFFILGAFLIRCGLGICSFAAFRPNGLFPVIFFGMLLGAIGEEIGWRGFLQPWLEEKFGIVESAVLVGLMWGLWHVGHYAKGAVFMAGFLMFTISASLLLAYLVHRANYNLLLAIVFHLSINIGFYLFSNEINTPSAMLIVGFVWTFFAGVISLLFFKSHTVKNL